MIYITGANGQLGRDLSRILDAVNIPYRGFDIDDWDITNYESADEILKSGECRVLVNCAAHTAVDQAETDREAAYLLNGEVPGLLKDIAEKYGAFLVHISTDFVFGNPLSMASKGSLSYEDFLTLRPWRVDDPVSPNGVYAESKRAGEESIVAYNRNAGKEDYYGAVIIRSSWVYTSHGKNFPSTMIRLASDPDRDKLTVIEDQIGRPTRAYRLAEFILAYLEKSNIINGKSNKPQFAENCETFIGEMLHFSNEGVASWYDFAVATIEIANEIGLLDRKIPVLPIPTEAYPTPAPRPRYSVMDLSTAREIMPSIPHWREDLRNVLLEMKDSGNNS